MKKHAHICLLSFLVFSAMAAICGGQALPALANAERIAQDGSAAVIFVYHRVGEDEYPESNIRIDQFAAHIQELAHGGYNVMPLPDIAQAIAGGTALPPLTVGISFDGGHRSILENAVPMLESNKLPYTVFIAAANADRKDGNYIGWDEIRSLSKSGRASIGLHTGQYARFNGTADSEITRQINNARARYREELGAEAMLFAYPFGEYGVDYLKIVEKAGFSAAFGQQSGVAFAGSDRFNLPRFSMTENFGGLDRFNLTARALPLPVTDIEPRDPLIRDALPHIGFTLDEGLAARAGDLSCFISGQPNPAVEIIGGRRVEIRAAAAFETDKVRINCTLPLPASENYEEPRWRWFGMQLFMNDDDESGTNEAGADLAAGAAAAGEFNPQ